MFRSVLAVAVFGLLWAFTSSQTVTCSGQYVPFTGEPFTSLNTSIFNEYVDLLSADITKANTTVNAENPTVFTCLASIDTAQTDCISCINTTCQARVDALKCTEVVAQTAAGGSCGLIEAICGIQTVVAKAGQALTKAGTAIESFVLKAVLDIKKVAEKVISTIGSGLQTAGNEIKKTATNIGKTAENIASKVGEAAEKVGEAIGNELEKAAKTVVKVVEDGAKEVKNFFEGLGGRKRRQTSTVEPTCETFKTDSNACLYYHSQCASCSAFGLGDATEPTTDQLISGVCSQADLDSYNLLNLAIQRIDDIIEAYANYTLYAARWDASSYVHPAGYQCVQVDIGMVVENITLNTSPNNPYVASSAGKIIADDIFKLLLP